MPGTVNHVFTSPVADGTNTQLVRPSNWNSEHLITLNAVGSEISNAFGTAGGVTFGYDGTNITASAPAGGGGLTNINVSAGATSANLSNLTFANGGGVSFGLTNSVITGSVATTYRASNDAIGLNTALTANGVSMTANSSGLSLNFPAFLTTARASNDAVGLNTALTVGPLAWTVNSAGISLNAGSAAGTTSGFAGNSISGSMTHNTAGLNLSLNHPAWLTTAMQSNAVTLSNINVSAGATSANLSALTFNNGGGVTFGLTNSVITGSVATTYRASNDAIGTNTAQSNVTWTANSAGLSLDARGYVGTATGFSGTNISATMTHNSAGFSLQLSGGGGGVVNQTGPNISAGSDSLWTSGTVTFGNNAFGSHITSNGSLVFKPAIGTAYAMTNLNFTSNTDGLSINNVDDHLYAWELEGAQTAGTTGTTLTTRGALFLSGGNGITLSGNSNTIVISAGGGGGVTNTQRFNWPPGGMTALGALGNGSFSLNRIQVEAGVSATRMEVPFLVSLASSATANTWGFGATVFGAIYTKNVSTLSSLSSAQQQFAFTLASNTAGQTQVIPHAVRPFSIPININMSAGEYYVGFGISTATVSSGTATTALGNTFSVMGGFIYTSAVPQVNEFTATTNTSTGLWGGVGVYSAAISTVPPAVSLSAINQTGSYYGRANYAVIFRNI